MLSSDEIVLELEIEKCQEYSRLEQDVDIGKVVRWRAMPCWIHKSPMETNEG